MKSYDIFVPMNNNKIQSEKIISCYIEKGRKPAALGTKSKDGNFIKTESGWQYIKNKTNNIMTNNENVKTGHKVMDKILEEIQPDLDEMVEYHRREAIEEGRTFTQRDKEYVELQYLSKLTQSVGNYIKSTDDIKNLQFETGPKGYTIYAQIVRDGKQYDFETEAIVAGGYNIQTKHYRYITKTELPHIFNSLFANVESKISHMKTEDRLRKNIKENDDEILKKQIDLNSLVSTNVDNKYRIQSLKGDIKRLEKKGAKWREQLESHMRTEAVKINPKEGDLKVIRDKDPWQRNPIGVYKFTNDNWKRVLRTNMSNIRKVGQGFYPGNDEDVIKYYKYKKELENS